ncbi:MAG TPA: cytochrome c biogenesis protein ResB [Candidatus Kapabacteria bacterium]|nr:cytochrome c biogenesis protein ResB [Candidatus Kapabacteria bacterium]
MLKNIVNVLTSLKLTVACLSLALGLVFIGTIAQVRLGLYIVQEQYFGSYFVWWGPQGSSWKIPVYPGGYLLGGILLINLIAAHIQRFELSKKKFGIFTVHAGLILLLVGQLVSQLFQVESYMAIEEGDQKNYSESGRVSELAIVDLSDTNDNLVVAVPQGALAKNKEIKHPSLPFTVKVQSFFDNADPTVAGTKIGFVEKPFQVAMNKRNIPATTIEIVTDEGSKGTFALSNWQTEKQLVQIMAENFNQNFHAGLIAPGKFTYKGKPYEITMRPKRYYKDFTVQLMDFTHDRYLGTEIPKNFSSRVRLKNTGTGEDREVLIYMNNPLRYGGETYYQGGFEPGDTVSILQVVKNPSWLTPYIAVVLVSVGLVVQFMYHLIGFAKKRSA